MYAGGVMAAKKWSDLSERNRRLIIAAAVAEAGLKTAALIDIKRRPASQIRGSKWIWAPGGGHHQLVRGSTTRILRIRTATAHRTLGIGPTHACSSHSGCRVHQTRARIWRVAGARLCCED